MAALLGVLFLATSTFATPAVPALCPGDPAPVEQASGFTTKAMCTALCGSSPSVSCSGATCSAVNQSCPSQRGSVTCDGTTHFCPVCTTVCTEGQIKNVNVGPTCGCEDGMSTPKDRYKCIGGEWVYQFSFCGGPFCPGP